MKNYLLNILISINLVLISNMSPAQSNISETCTKALNDINNLYSFTTAANPTEFRILVEQIHNDWTNRMASDSCTLGNCTADSPELKMSAIILAVNGLSSKLMIYKDLGVPNTLKESVDDAKNLVTQNCS